MTGRAAPLRTRGRRPKGGTPGGTATAVLHVPTFERSAVELRDLTCQSSCSAVQSLMAGPPSLLQNGTCRRGDACPFAHGVFECWLHPSRYRTQVRC